MKSAAFRSNRTTAALAVLFLLASCGGDAPGDDDVLGETPGGPEASVPVPEGPGPGVIELALASFPGYSAAGSVTLTADGDSIGTEVVVSPGLAPGEYGIHIHEGICAEGGRVVVALSSVAVEESGQGTSSTRFPAERLELGGTYFVMLHEPEGNPIACAELAPFHL